MDEERKSGVGPRFLDAKEQKKELHQELKAENDNHRLAISNLEKKPISNIKSDTALISSVLQVLAIAFTGNPKYSRGAYVIMLTLLSLLLSIGMEIVIVGSFKVLSYTHGNELEMDFA